MRASDIVNQLAAILPKMVDDFTDQFTITSLTRSGTTVTAVTDSAHGLLTGKSVNIVGAMTPIECAITRLGIVATMITDEDHDLTENAGFDVQVTGATEPEFEGAFQLLSVPNRRTITFLVDDSGPTTATGSPLLLNGSNIFKSYNGLKEVTAVPTTTSFEYEVTDATLFTPAYGAIVAKTSPRISTSVSFERLIAAYTKQQTGKAWLFVVTGDAVADKLRGINTDMVANNQPSHYFNQRLIQNIALYVFLPTSGELSGRGARDRCEELLRPICRSILRAKFPSLLGEADNNPLMITSHGLQFYNGAFYVHAYNFEASLQLTDSDAYSPDGDVAFRDILLHTALDVGAEIFDTAIDLDDNQL